MDLEQRVAQNFAANIENTTQAASTLGPAIASASTRIVETLLQGGKVLSCGNGGSAAASQHFMAMMIHRFERERPGLPAIALSSSSSTMTSVADSLSCEQIFSSQISALGHPGDVLLAITSSGNSPNILRAMDAARERQMKMIVLNGGDGGDVRATLQEHETEIRVPGSAIHRIQEVQLLIIHCLCDLIDAQLLGS